MADQIELLKEAHRRGILPESKRALFDEAVKRGLIAVDTPDQSQMMPSHGQQEQPEGWKQTVSTYAKPVLETAGLVGGGLLGTAAGPAGTVGGAALGYGAGRQAGKILDNFLLDTPAEQPLPAVKNAALDLVAGAEMEMGGQAIGAGVVGLGRALKPIARKIIPQGITKEAAQRQAAEIFAQAQSSPESAVLSKVQEANKTTADALMARKGLDPNLLSPSQRTGDFKAAYLEQGAASADPAFAAKLAERESGVAGKARADVVNALRTGPPIAAKSAQETGEAIISKLQKAKIPVKQAERDAWSQVSTKYQIDTPATNGAFTEIQSSIIPPDIKSKVAGVQEFYASVPKTVEGLRAVEADLTQKIRVASQAGETNTVRVLSKIKDGIVKDFDALSEAAGTGKLFEHNGKLVNPELLAKEIETSTANIERINAAGSVPDSEAVINAIRSKGFPSMRNVGETADSFASRMANEYRKYFGKEPPMIADPKTAESLVVHQNKIAANQEIINNMTPADDVAKQIAAAKKATIERVEKFGKGVTEGVLSKGKEISGLRTTYESIPAKYFTQQGADDLIRAVGPQDAKSLMVEHVTASMEKLTKNGTLNVPAAMQFLQKNAPVLGKLKLQKEAEGIIREQIPAAIKSRLEQRLAEDRFGREVNTLTEIRGIIRDFGPAMRQVYGGGSKEITALLDYHKMLQVLGRNKNVSFSGGSNTADKLFGAFQNAPKGSLMQKVFDGVIDTVVGGGGGLMVGGPVGGVAGVVAARSARETSKIISDHQKDAVMKMLQKAITDPEEASLLLRIAKGYKPKTIEMERIAGKTGYEWTKTGLAAKVIGPQMVGDDE